MSTSRSKNKRGERCPESRKRVEKEGRSRKERENDEHNSTTITHLDEGNPGRKTSAVQKRKIQDL
jgi:hypothetical protein